MTYNIPHENGHFWKGKLLLQLDRNARGIRLARSLTNFTPRDDWQFLPWHDCIKFAPCGCVAYFYVGIPVAPVERSFNNRKGHNVEWGRKYRCLICGATWNDEWLEKRKGEVYKGKV